MGAACATGVEAPRCRAAVRDAVARACRKGTMLPPHQWCDSGLLRSALEVRGVSSRVAACLPPAHRLHRLQQSTLTPTLPPLQQATGEITSLLDSSAVNAAVMRLQLLQHQQQQQQRRRGADAEGGSEAAAAAAEVEQEEEEEEEEGVAAASAISQLASSPGRASTASFASAQPAPAPAPSAAAGSQAEGEGLAASQRRHVTFGQAQDTEQGDTACPSTAGSYYYVDATMIDEVMAPMWQLAAEVASEVWQRACVLGECGELGGVGEVSSALRC